MNKQNQSKDRYSITPELVSSWQGYWAYYLESLHVDEAKIAYWNSLDFAKRESMMQSSRVADLYQENLAHLRQAETGDATPKRFKLFIAMEDAWSDSPAYKAERKAEQDAKDNYPLQDGKCKRCDASKKNYELMNPERESVCVSCIKKVSQEVGEMLEQQVADFEAEQEQSKSIQSTKEVKKMKPKKNLLKPLEADCYATDDRPDLLHISCKTEGSRKRYASYEFRTAWSILEDGVPKAKERLLEEFWRRGCYIDFAEFARLLKPMNDDEVSRNAYAIFKQAIDEIIAEQEQEQS